MEFFKTNKNHKPLFINNYGSTTIENYGQLLVGLQIGLKRPTLLYFCETCMYAEFKRKHGPAIGEHKEREWHQQLLTVLAADATIIKYICPTTG